MRVLLCDRVRGLFFQSPRAWTMEPGEAQDFGSSINAAHFAREQGLEAEVYLDFGDPEYNVLLPLQTRTSKPDPAAF